MYEGSKDWPYKASKLMLNPQIPRKRTEKGEPKDDWVISDFTTSYEHVAENNPWLMWFGLICEYFMIVFFHFWMCLAVKSGISVYQGVTLLMLFKSLNNSLYRLKFCFIFAASLCMAMLSWLCMKCYKIRVFLTEGDSQRADIQEVRCFSFGYPHSPHWKGDLK